MTFEKAYEHMNNINNDIKRTCRDARQARRCAERYANKHGLKFKKGEPSIIFEDGSERVITFSVKPNGGIHMDIATSPAYALLGGFSEVKYN